MAYGKLLRHGTGFWFALILIMISIYFLLSSGFWLFYWSRNAVEFKQFMIPLLGFGVLSFFLLLIHQLIKQKKVIKKYVGLFIPPVPLVLFLDFDFNLQPILGKLTLIAVIFYIVFPLTLMMILFIIARTRARRGSKK